MSIVSEKRYEVEKKKRVEESTTKIPLPCVWTEHFNNAQKLKCFVFEWLAIKSP